MSADNWAHCPRCTQRAQAALDERKTAIDTAYGKISVEKFDAARVQYAKEITLISLHRLSRPGRKTS